MAVHIRQLTLAERAIPRAYRSCHPPIFDSTPSRADLELAIKLLAALDRESFVWYGGQAALADWRKQLAAMPDA